ncbi:MAG TPA: O-antigen ligase family protein, partial [Candidatus Dormibacteraeota bacterium]|nr:O-antigen ligase family protein [Candidatus Dormibacteraeota bacterium]
YSNVPASRAFARLAAALSFAYTLRGKALGLPFTTLELALVALAAVYIVEKLVSREPFPDPRRLPYFWPVAVLVVAATISVFTSAERTAAAGLWKAYFFEPAVGAYIVADVFRTREHLGKLVQGFFVAGIVISVLTEMAFLFAVAVHRPRLVEEPIYVLYNTPNATGLFLGPLVAIAAALVLYGDSRERGSGLLFLIVGGPALALSFSRGAWLGVLAAFILLAALNARRLVLLGGVAVASALALLVPAVRRRIAHEFNPTDPFNSVNSRVAVWKATLQMLRHRPIFGGGLSGFHEAIAPYKQVSGYSEQLLYPHNTFLTFWTETGLLGLVAFVWLLVDVARRCFRAIRAPTPQHAYHVAFAAAWATILVHGQLDVPILKNDLAWLTMALLGMHGAALRLDAQYARQPAGAAAQPASAAAA